jgi:transcriptional regulator with XRE-family HTH domain
MIRAAAKANPGGAPRRLPLSPLGRRIDTLAKKQGVSLGRLAVDAGLSRQALGKIRNGSTACPSVETAIAIARALHVSVEALYSGTGHPRESAVGRPAYLPLAPFGVRLQRRMDELGITRPDLARRSGIHHVTIWRWMKGQSRVTLEDAVRLAKALRCGVESLLPRT